MDESLFNRFLNEMELSNRDPVYLLRMYGISGLLNEFEEWLLANQYLQKQGGHYLDWNDIVREFIKKEN